VKKRNAIQENKCRMLIAPVSWKASSTKKRNGKANTARVSNRRSWESLDMANQPKPRPQTPNVIVEKMARPLDTSDIAEFCEVNDQAARRLARRALHRGFGRRINGKTRFSLPEIERIAQWSR